MIFHGLGDVSIFLLIHVHFVFVLLFPNKNNATVKFIEHIGFYVCGLGPQERDCWLLSDYFPESLMLTFLPAVSESPLITYP